METLMRSMGNIEFFVAKNFVANFKAILIPWFIFWGIQHSINQNDHICFRTHAVNKYMLKVNNRNTRKSYEV